MAYSKLVHHFLEDSAQLYPERQAFFANNQWHTFSEIEAKSNQLAHLLLEKGLKRGERVAFLIENSIEYVITYYAVLKAGGVTVALNTELAEPNIAYILSDCDVKIFITTQGFQLKISSLLSEITSTVFIWKGKGKAGEADEVENLLPDAYGSFPENKPTVRLIDLDIASIVYTSGSTGQPRGATLSHLNIVTNTRSIVEYLELTKEDRIMVVMPFYYIYGKSLLNTHFFVGGSVVVDNRFMFPNVILKTMVEQKVTGFSGVPSTFTLLLNRSSLKATEFKDLRYVTQAGGGMAPAIQKEVAEVFSPAKLFIMYGATEASARLSYMPPADLHRKWGSIGKAIPNVDLFVADAKGNEVPQGEQGEIVARGANMMSGYWNHPEETQKVLKHGLYYTGDLGVMDEEDFIFVVGRSKDMIKIGGNRASAKEIEDALYACPLIADAAVIAVEDKILSEVPKAYLVLKSKMDDETAKEEILNFIKEKLALYKIPKYFEFRESLPKNKSGKIQKLKLD